MSLANLSIDVTVNTGAAQRGLRDVGATAQEQFMRSGAAVDDFRAEILNASSALDRAARSMGAGMDRAANAIEASSKRSEDAIQSIQDAANDVKFDGLAERVSAAFGTAAGAGYAATQSWLNKTEEYVVAKGKAIAIGMALTAAAAGVSAAYAAYKVVSASYTFLKGLLTGDSYKSDAIDRLLERYKTAQDEQAKAKQESLDLDVKVETSMRENGEALDRLGVKYKDSNGKLLTHQQFLGNVRDALAQFREGYDRVKAAQDIGVGSLEQVNAALQDNSKKVAEAKARNNEYLLGIGPQGQAEIARYQKAIEEFNLEMQRTSDGFKHATADAIMPALTDLAEFFRDGWPTAVRLYRGGISTMVGLAYAFKDGIYIVAESILGSMESIGKGILSVGEAAYQVMQGRFTDAKDTLMRGMEAAWQRFKDIGANIEAQVMHNDKAIRLAVGEDGKKATVPDPNARDGAKGTYTPPASKALAAAKSPYQTYLDELDRMVKKVEENEYASLRLKAAQLAQKEGVKDLTQAYEAINRIQRGDSQKVVEERSQALNEAANAYEFETSLIGKDVLEQQKLEAARRQWLQTEQLIRNAKQSGRPLDDAAIEDLQQIQKTWVKQYQAQIEARDKLQRSFDVGVSASLNNYVRSATDAAANVSNLITGSLQRMEDAFISWARTGKLSAKDLFAFMAEEYLRQTFRMAAASVAKNGLGNTFAGIGSVLSSAGNFLGSFFGHANGLDYVPYNGYPALLHEGEKVLTRQDAAASRSGAGMGSISVGAGQVIQIGQGVSRAEVAQAINAANRQSEARIQRSLRQGSFA